MQTIFIFIILWGVWLLMPLLVDGMQMLINIYYAIQDIHKNRKPQRKKIRVDQLPKITVIIPTFNEEKIIERCINSVMVQEYPPEKLELIVIDDGSADKTKEVINNHLNGNGKNHLNGNGNGHIKINGEFVPIIEFKGAIKLFANGHRGKSYALNTGIKHAHGDIIMTVDSDVVLTQRAVYSVAEAFVRDKSLDAATGNIEVDWDIIEERDKKGNLVLDKKGEIKTKQLNIFENLSAKCQFLEYLNSFYLGKRSQNKRKAIYTLSGACSAFRRKTLLSCLYEDDTVSEDTDLTFNLRKQKNVKIGHISKTIALLEPTVDWDKLYAQRVRWHRGEIEVCSKHKDMVGNKDYGFFGRFSLVEILVSDHTLAFNRLVWTPLILLFPLFGYSPTIIIGAIVFMYIFYVILDLVATTFCYYLGDEATKKRTEEAFMFCFILPIFRFITYYFRMSGYLLTLKEAPQWQVNGPVNGVKNIINGNGSHGKNNKKPKTLRNAPSF